MDSKKFLCAFIRHDIPFKKFEEWFYNNPEAKQMFGRQVWESICCLDFYEFENVDFAYKFIQDYFREQINIFEKLNDMHWI